MNDLIRIVSNLFEIAFAGMVVIALLAVSLAVIGLLPTAIVIGSYIIVRFIFADMQ